MPATLAEVLTYENPGIFRVSLISLTILFLLGYLVPAEGFEPPAP